MFKKDSLRFAAIGFVLLAISLACSLGGTTVDCNVPDLIASINNANANPAPSTLDLAAGCTYTLTAIDNTATSSFGGSTFDYGDNGLPQITTPITINGNNATIIRDSSAPPFRIFFITDTGDLTINDLTLENGFADRPGSAYPSSGGAVYVRGSIFTANNSVITSNQASFHGGAIFSVDIATVQLTGSAVTNNSAPLGGGIHMYHHGLLNIDSSDISDNSASNTGGGINAEHGAELVISNSTISGNTSARHGGGIFILRTPLTVEDSEFISNHADEFGGGMGYVNDSSESVLITGSTFSSNSADLNGGGIYFMGELMSINNTTIQTNIAVNGAGMFNGETGDPKYLSRPDTAMIVTGSTIQENTASESGGGAYNEGEMNCGESNFIGNTADLLGGGIQNTGELEVLGCQFEKNTSAAAGGGINNENTAEVRGSDFSVNTSGRGGGIASSAGSVTVSDTDFTENESGGEGGGLYNDGYMKVELCTLTGNEAFTLGGGIHNMEELEVWDYTFEGNLAFADGGGWNSYSRAAVTGSTFNGNKGFRGGGLSSVGGDTTILNSTFSGNAATDSGGGVFNMGPLIGDVTPGGSMNMSFVTIAYNSAPSGGGIATSGGGLNIKNAIVALSTIGGDCASNNVDMAALGENIDSDGSCPGFTLKDDPLLKILANYGGPTDTHALQTDSPAIDAAPDCTTIGGAAVTVDQRGVARPGGSLCDLGAFEDEIGGPLPVIEPCTFTAKINVFCRLGPDDSLYPVVDSFTAGQSAPVVGRSWDKVFAYVEGPATRLVCAVPATEKFGTLTGDCEDVEVMIPPDVDESLDDVEQGCTVKDKSGQLVCVAPCPPDAKPGNPCTP